MSARDIDDELRITTKKVRELCGGVSEMTIIRWLKRDELNFPRPIYINSRRYWKRCEIESWLRNRETSFRWRITNQVSGVRG